MGDHAQALPEQAPPEQALPEQAPLVQEPPELERVGLEQALARLEGAADAALKGAAGVTSALKRVRAAAQTGNLRDLRPALSAAERAVSGLGEEAQRVKAAWDTDEEAYLAGGAYVRELLNAAAQVGLRIYELDDRLYAYPTLVQILAVERTALIDRNRERRLRPSVLAGQLKALQERPPRFKAEAFLETLFDVYTIAVDQAVARRGLDVVGPNPVVRLLDVYGLLTLRPGQTREYSRQEFARDVYLLDQGDVATTRKGATVSFPASTATKGTSGTLRVITRGGQEKLYYGLVFRGVPTPATLATPAT